MSNRFSIFFSLAIFTVGIGFLLLSIAVWLRFHVQVPIQDIISILPLVESGVNHGWGSISLQEWLKPISGAHRIPVTRALMLVDYSFLGGNNYAIYLSAWASIALLVFAYLRAAGLQLTDDWASRFFIAGLALIFLCNPSQYMNMINPINASWFVALASSAVCMLIIISAGKKLGLLLLIVALFFAAIAAFSNFAGMLTCLILPVVALHQRSRLTGLVLIFSAVLAFFYFYGVGSPVSGAGDPLASQNTGGAAAESVSRLSRQLKSPDERLRIVTKTIRTVGLHLAAPLSKKHPFVGSLAVLGSVLLIGYQWLMLGYKWSARKEPASRSVEFTLVMATICLGISCAIPLGRIIFNQPLSPRYQTITMVYWLSISCLIYFKAQGLDGKRQLKRALVLLACIPALPIFGAFNSAMTSVVPFSHGANSRQILGKMGVIPFKKKHAWSQEFLTAYSFRPLDVQRNNLQEAEVNQILCDGFWLDETTTNWPGMQRIFLIPVGISQNPFLGRLELRGHNGETGILYAHVPREYELPSIFFGDRKWMGFYRGDINDSMPITLFFDPIIGRRYKCVLRERL